MLTLADSSSRLPRITDGGFAWESILLALLALAALFRGWGFWPFALLALPFAPALARASSNGDLLASGMANSALAWLSMVGLAFMILMGRSRSA